MTYFGRFYLDREKDIAVDLYRDGDAMEYRLRTPNHHSGNLITNLARVCRADLTEEEETGLKVMTGPVFSYVDGENRQVFILRLGNTKVANIYPDGTIERKATVPAIAKTLMSQTKDYRLDLFRTLVKTYILSECKFRTDLHTHMNAILEPDALIALGIAHQIRYPLYYVKKLGLELTEEQQRTMAARRARAEESLDLTGLEGKYRDRRIDDNCFINVAKLILGHPEAAERNIAKIRASLAVLKDGQAVFSNLEKVYLYRYVFTRGVRAEDPMPAEALREKITDIPDPDIRRTAAKMLADRQSKAYGGNTLFQDKLLWIARSYAAAGVRYAEISDTALAKADQAPGRLAEIHGVMPAAMRETGVTLRFLAGIRRTPLTIVKDQVAPRDYLRENIRTLEAVAEDPYLAGCDILGEEINDIEELKPLIERLTALAGRIPDFVIRIHAGESDSLRGNVAGSLRCVRESLAPGQPMPALRIGHGLYTSNLKSARGQALLKDLKESGAVLEFQISSNVRLNNLSRVEDHPLKQYLRAGVACVQGTDGGALYGTNSIDEELALERLLGLTPRDLKAMCRAEERVMRAGLEAFRTKKQRLGRALKGRGIREYYEAQLQAEGGRLLTMPAEKRRTSAEVLEDRIRPLPAEKFPLILAGGSFNSDRRRSALRPELLGLLDDLLARLNPQKTYFVIGHKLSAYEKALVEKNAGRFEIFAVVPTLLTPREAAALRRSGVSVRLSIEPYGLGLYKSIAYEIFKNRASVLLALDGNAAGANLIQEAKNARVKCHIFVSRTSRGLREKTRSLEGYIRLFDPAEDIVPEIAALIK
ncbi:MAG: adenosine deaminase [Lachnospiraceae bacterium]|nr:adenosine deaminase [Lachnospiraceae bacterium]